MIITTFILLFLAVPVIVVMLSDTSIDWIEYKLKRKK